MWEEGGGGGGNIYPLVVLRNGYLANLFTLSLSLQLIDYNQLLLLHGNMWLKISVLMYLKKKPISCKSYYF